MRTNSSLFMEGYRWAWMDEIADKMGECFDSAFSGADPEYPPTSVLADYHFNDGSFIEVEMFKHSQPDVFIYHADKGNERECPNLERYIQKSLPRWDDYLEAFNESCEPYDEWNEHGFRDEADFWHYIFG